MVNTFERPQIPEVDWILGVDLAQGGADATAIVVVERTEPLFEDQARYDVIHIERYHDRLSPRIVPERLMAIWEILQDLHIQRELRRGVPLGPRPAETPIRIAVDVTGVGQFGVDPLIQAGFDPVSIHIHGGNAVVHPQRDLYRVPKKDLAGVVSVLLGTDRLRIAKDLEHTDRLRKELENFRVKISATGHESFAAGVGGDAWREGQHDDLVLATAMAVWLGEWQGAQISLEDLKLAWVTASRNQLAATYGRR